MSIRSSRKPTSTSRQGRGRTAAARYLREAEGDPASRLYNQSLDLLHGRGVAEDAARSFAINAEAAATGLHDAILAMGWFYWNGIGVEQDWEEGRRWYRKSARQGDPRAMFSLGQEAFQRGDDEEARTWLRRAADAGHARSLFWLGKLHWRGYGVPKDRAEAMRLFQAASDRKVPEARRFMSLYAHLQKKSRR